MMAPVDRRVAQGATVYFGRWTCRTRVPVLRIRSSHSAATTRLSVHSIHGMCYIENTLKHRDKSGPSLIASVDALTSLEQSVQLSDDNVVSILHSSLSPILSLASPRIHIASLACGLAGWLSAQIHTYRNRKPCGGHRTTSIKARR
jgi:hypothetical protein